MWPNQYRNHNRKQPKDLCFAACEASAVPFRRVWFTLHTEMILAASCPDRRTRSGHQAGPDRTLHREASEWGGHRRSVATTFWKSWFIRTNAITNCSEQVRTSRLWPEWTRSRCWRSPPSNGSKGSGWISPASPENTCSWRSRTTATARWATAKPRNFDAPKPGLGSFCSCCCCCCVSVGPDLSCRVSCRSTRLRCRSCQPRPTLPAPTGARSLPRTSLTAVTSPWPFTVRGRPAAVVSASLL